MPPRKLTIEAQFDPREDQGVLVIVSPLPVEQNLADGGFNCWLENVIDHVQERTGPAKATLYHQLLVEKEWP